MRRPVVPDSASRAGGDVSDEKFAKKFPLVLEHLTHAEWEDGGARETSTLTIFVEEGLVKIGLNDRDAQRTLYRSADTLEGAIAAVEKALAGPGADWRPWKGRRRK